MTRLILITLTACAATACSSGSSTAPVVPAPTPAPPAATVNFTDFVKEQIQITDEKLEPVEISELDFVFPETDDPDAFNDVLGTGGV